MAGSDFPLFSKAAVRGSNVDYRRSSRGIGG